MKLNKLLTPILGLATVSTVVVPLASCTTTATEDHVKISNKSEEVTCDSNGLATFLFVLDSHDYDENGFKVNTTVSAKDTTGVATEDFDTEWEIDGDHLLVKVLYDGGEEAPEDDVTIKLNIHINYGTAWNKTFDVKFNYAAAKAEDMTWNENSNFFITSYHTFKKNESYTYTVDLSNVPEGTHRPLRWINTFVTSSEKKVSSFTLISFNKLTVKIGDKTIEPSLSTYQTVSGPIAPETAIVSVTFNSTFMESLESTDVITFAFEDCHIYSSPDGSSASVSELDQLENGYSVFGNN